MGTTRSTYTSRGKLRGMLEILKNGICLNTSITSSPLRFVAQLTHGLESELHVYLAEIRQAMALRTDIAKQIKHVTGAAIFKPEWGSISYQVGEILYMLVRATKPSRLLETGTGSGFSSIFILYAMEMNRRGALLSTDVVPKFIRTINGIYTSGAGQIFMPKNTMPGWMIPDWLHSRLQISLLDSNNSFPAVVKSFGPVDFFFHDSNHSYENMSFEFKTIWRFLRSGGVIASHDVAWNSAFREFARAVREEPYIFYRWGAGHVGGLAKVRELSLGNSQQ
jgi:predicted O-methyltransferase YrrM